MHQTTGVQCQILKVFGHYVNMIHKILLVEKQRLKVFKNVESVPTGPGQSPGGGPGDKASRKIYIVWPRQNPLKHVIFNLFQL